MLDGRRAEEFLRYVAQNEHCEWCRYPHKPIYRLRLCRHCYQVKVELKRLHRVVDGDRGILSPATEFRYKVALLMAEFAQAEGQKYGSIGRRDVSALDLEWEFRFLSREFVRRDLYDHAAYLFESYTPIERKYLLYVVSRLSRERLRRERRRRAQAEVCGESLEDILTNRAHGTYRVEDDV